MVGQPHDRALAYTDRSPSAASVSGPGHVFCPWRNLYRYPGSMPLARAAGRMPPWRLMSRAAAFWISLMRWTLA